MNIHVRTNNRVIDRNNPVAGRFGEETGCCGRMRAAQEETIDTLGFANLIAQAVSHGGYDLGTMLNGAGFMLRSLTQARGTQRFTGSC